jgi:Transaldolase/Fructose-6-phosphate aldolase
LAQERVAAHAQNGLSALDEEMAQVATASFAHPEFDVLARPALALAGVKPNVGHEFFRALEAAHIANNRQQRKGADEAVTLIGTPAKIDSSIAGRPSFVPGILINRFFELALEDLTRAADLFRPVFDRTNGVDGWVSLEVSPLLAHDTASTLAAAKSLHARAGRPNLLSGLTVTKPFADRSIVRAAILNRVVEDRGIRSEPRYRKLIDIALECTAVNEVARNVVQPQTLTQVVKQLSWSHFV